MQFDGLDAIWTPAVLWILYKQVFGHKPKYCTKVKSFHLKKFYLGSAVLHVVELAE